MFGYTNDENEYKRVIKYREDAIRDGWESEEQDILFQHSYTIMKKVGFVMHIISRVMDNPNAKWKYEAEITIWGTDQLQILPPQEYNFEDIVYSINTCPICGATEVNTFRYSFAGRCCEKCLPDMKNKHEFPGWYD